MEFVQINYPVDRTVYVDGEDNGSTNTVIRVDTGTHRFDLGEPLNYAPSFRRRLVEGTSALQPLVLDFDPEDNT